MRSALSVSESLPWPCFVAKASGDQEAGSIGDTVYMPIPNYDGAHQKIPRTTYRITIHQPAFLTGNPADLFRL
jgi:hypothetical protein